MISRPIRDPSDRRCRGEFEDPSDRRRAKRKLGILAKYGTVGLLKEVNFRRCGRIGKVFHRPLQMAKQSCVRFKIQPMPDVKSSSKKRADGLELLESRYGGREIGWRADTSEGLKLPRGRRCGWEELPKSQRCGWKAVQHPM